MNWNKPLVIRLLLLGLAVLAVVLTPGAMKAIAPRVDLPIASQVVPAFPTPPTPLPPVAPVTGATADLSGSTSSTWRPQGALVNPPQKQSPNPGRPPAPERSAAPVASPPSPPAEAPSPSPMASPATSPSPPARPVSRPASPALYQPLVPATTPTAFSFIPGGQLFGEEYLLTSVMGAFIPPQQVVQVNSTNYDFRMLTDIQGRVLTNTPMVVLHETVGSAGSAINTFRNAHANDADQVSYHSLIKRDGTIVYLVPPELRAFGAGNSAFNGETVRLDSALPPSVNNFAYHTSLETPPDGRGSGANHSGYTDAQYRSLAWLIAQTRVPDSRITTHRLVDRGRNRRDPRSFDRQKFQALLRTYPRP